MNNNDKGRMARHLKNEAKKLSRSTGLPYHQCLNQLSQASGNSSYNDFVKKNNLTVIGKGTKGRLERTLPKPLTLIYYMLTARNGRKRPNAKVSVENHLEMGKLLKQLYQATEYNNRANKLIRFVRGHLDDWVQCEYVGQEELTDAVFFQMYYGNIDFPVHISPTDAFKADLVKKCYKIKGILKRGYHDCKPVSELQGKLDKAIMAINNWPVVKRERHKGVFEKRLIPGTLVYVKGDKAPLIAFSHSFRNGVVTAYGDAGAVTAARHEISVFRDQSNAKNFKPMRLYLPYGRWTCSDGTQVLYNRDYCPLWARKPDGTISAIDADYWIDHEYDEPFFTDGQAPWAGQKNKAYLDRCLEELRSWGVEDKLPDLLKRLPNVVAEGDTRLLRPKNINKRYQLA